MDNPNPKLIVMSMSENSVSESELEGIKKEFLEAGVKLIVVKYDMASSIPPRFELFHF